MAKITQKMIEVSYKYGIMYANGEISKKDAADKVVYESDMNRVSAENSLEIIDHLLKEKDYFPTMSAKETIWKLEKIKKDYGIYKFLSVIDIVERHLNTKGAPNYKIREYIKRIKEGGSL